MLQTDKEAANPLTQLKGMPEKGDVLASVWSDDRLEAFSFRVGDHPFSSRLVDQLSLRFKADILHCLKLLHEMWLGGRIRHFGNGTTSFTQSSVEPKAYSDLFRLRANSRIATDFLLA